ncbi:MAG: hypothetical protein WD078_09240 [Woeseia sp.]
MNVLPKRNVLSEDNALFRRAKPVLFDIGCRGILAASRRRIMITGVTSLLMMPLAWITSIILRLPHVALVTGIWWVFRDELGESGIPANPALALGIVVVFYRQIYDEFFEIFLHLVILVSGGRAIRWLCAGYIENAPFRQGLFSKD